MNYRLKSNRVEGFMRWYAWSLKYKDCDPAVWATNYLNKRFEHNDEQRLWFCWLYGNTYHLPTAWILMNEFPDFELVTVDRLTEWNTKNYKRLRYQTDTKWNKGHLPAMFESYKKFIGNGTQREKLESFYGKNDKESFTNVWNNVKENLHKFGRYSTWFYLQHLASTSDINISPTDLMLHDYSGSRSHRNGLCLAIGQDDLVDQKLSFDMCENLSGYGDYISFMMTEIYPELKGDINYFTMETSLCAFKKLFRKSRGRYLGYYLDRQAEEIIQCEKDGWDGIDWSVLWDARRETIDPRLDNKLGVDKKRFSSFLNTGKIDRLEWMFDDEIVSKGLEDFT